MYHAATAPPPQGPMGITHAAIAFLRALDGPGTEPGHAPASPPPPPAQAPAALADIVGAHAVKLAGLEASVEGLRSYIKEEADRAVRASEAARRAAQRIAARFEGSGGELEAGGDVSGDDVPAGRGEPMLPLHGRVAQSAEPAPPTDEEVRAQLRWQLAFGAPQ